MPPKPHPTEIPTENFSDRNFSVQRVGRFGRQFALPTPLPSQSVGVAELAFIFRFFKTKEVERPRASPATISLRASEYA